MAYHVTSNLCWVSMCCYSHEYIRPAIYVHSGRSVMQHVIMVCNTYEYIHVVVAVAKTQYLMGYFPLTSILLDAYSHYLSL